jgi:transglutaminase/protease-like cytokinesis protein 3
LPGADKRLNEIFEKEAQFMRNTLKALTTLVLSVTMTAGMAQTSASSGDIRKASHHARRVPKKLSVEQQIKDMHDQLQAEMQSQINQLKLQLSNSIAQLQGAQQQAAAANAAAAQAQLQAQQQQQQTAENIAAVSNLQGAVTRLQTSNSGMETQVQQVEKTSLDNQKAIEEPTAIRYKGVTITPGGFLAGETVWRQKTLNADMYTNWNGQP